MSEESLENGNQLQQTRRRKPARNPIVKEISFGVSHIPGQALGLQLIKEEGKLIVCKVKEGSPAYGHVFIGDIIVALDGEPVTDFNRFAAKVRSNLEKRQLVITVRRRTRLLRFLGPENELLISREVGCDYLLIQLNCKEDPKRDLGLVMSTLKRMTIVADIDVGSFADGQFRILDRVIAINGTPIDSSEDAEELIQNSGGILAILIERPISEEKRNLHLKALEPDASSVTEITVWSVADPKSDVGRIAAAEKERMKAGEYVPTPILRGKEETAQQGKGIIVKEGHAEVKIGSDTKPDKHLRHVDRN